MKTVHLPQLLSGKRRQPELPQGIMFLEPHAIFREAFLLQPLIFEAKSLCIKETKKEVRNVYSTYVLYLCPPSEGGELKSANLGAMK